MHSFVTNNSNVPAFLIKLWKLVEDPLCDDLIAWSDSGASFIIKDQIRFSKELLPQYFKHNNMASFIRQLNMYGFRKVMNYERTGLRTENDEMEFQHTFFCKGQSELLDHIKRKIPNKVSEPTIKSDARDILTDLTSIREKQENMDSMLLKMKQENELLWRELTSMRKKHKAQEHVIQKVIQFLVSIVQRSNQNISVPRKIPRMLYDSSENQENSQVSGTVDVLRKKNPSITMSEDDKLVSPLGPVIHEVTDLDHDQLENQLSLPFVKSPEERVENNAHNSETENHENSCPLENSSLNSPINMSTNMEPLSILEPLHTNTPSLNSEDGTEEESVLGIPLEYIAASPCNVISIPDDEPCDKIISLPAYSNSNSDISYSISSTPDMLIYTTSKSDFDDSLLSESLNTPKIPTIHIEDLYTSDMDTGKKNDKNQNEDKVLNSKTDKQERQQNEHNYQLAVSDPSNILKSSSITKNSLSNHLLNVEEDLNWLQDQISCGTWNIDPNKLLGLFSTDDVANNETLAGEIADEITVKAEPVDIVGNELVQFTPTMLDVDLGLGNNQFLQCLNQDEVVSTVSDINKNPEDQKNFLSDVLKTDQVAASEAAEYLLSNGAAAKQKSPRRPKFQKLQKAKRRKLK